MTNWTALLPKAVPREVEQARKQTLALRSRLDAQRRAIEQAKQAVAQAIRDDEAQMARALTQDREPVSKVGPIEKAQQALAAEERKQRALDVAIDSSEQALRAAIEKARATWTTDANVEAQTKRAQALDKVMTLRREIEAMREAFATVAWLNDGGGFDRAQPPRQVTTGSVARSSASVTASSEPLALAQLLDWVEEGLQPQTSPAPPVHHPVPGPAPEAFAPRAMPVEAT